MSNTAVSEAGTTYPVRAPEYTPVFCGVRVDHLFRFLCCPILCLRYEFRVDMSVTINAKTMFDSSLPPVIGWSAHVLFK